MSKNINKNFLIGYCFLCIIILWILQIVSTQNISDTPALIAITFGVNALLIVYNLCKNNYLGYGLSEIFYVFMFIFMVVSPFIQYINGYFPWEDTYLITNEILIKSNIIVLVFLVVYMTYPKLIKRDINIKKLKKIDNYNVIFRVGLILSVIFSIYLIFNIGFTNLFSRSTSSINIQSSSINNIIRTVFRAFPVIITCLHILYKRKYGEFRSIIQFGVILSLAILVNFPTAIPRFWAATTYIAIFITIKPKFKNKYLFKLLIILGLFIVFPMINLFRNNTISDLINTNIIMPDPMKDFLKGDYDSYSMLARSLIYVNMNAVTYGRQLLGAILFFVPRTLWNTKPIGSGAFMGESFGWSFTNVSCPYIAEGYLNFGLIGVVIFAIILSSLVKKFDSKQAYFVKDTKKTIYYSELFYPTLLGLLFFSLRGDLMSAMSYIIGFGVPVIILFTVDKIYKYVK